MNFSLGIATTVLVLVACLWAADHTTNVSETFLKKHCHSQTHTFQVHHLPGLGPAEEEVTVIRYTCDNGKTYEKQKP